MSSPGLLSLCNWQALSLKETNQHTIKINKYSFSHRLWSWRAQHTAALHQSWGSCKEMYIPRLWAASQLAPLWILTFKNPDQSKARIRYLETQDARLQYQQPHQTFIFVPKWPGFCAKSIGRTDGQGIQILYLVLCSQQGSQEVPTEVCASMWALGAGCWCRKPKGVHRPPLPQTVVWTEDSLQVSPAFSFLCKAKHWARKTIYFPISWEAPQTANEESTE